ncbi:hypothetical protein ACFFSA_16960 [Nonomuraea helvata]|uniref:Uncharacterized protein n=1 Tax=Nonomuraea helvata TaxID=37484 RepID=A0ABV5RZC7_9ACTN
MRHDEKGLDVRPVVPQGAGQAAGAFGQRRTADERVVLVGDSALYRAAQHGERFP